MNNLRKTLCKNLCKYQWNDGGFFSTFLTRESYYFIVMWIMFGFHKIIHVFSKAFSTKHLFGFSLLISHFYTVSTGLITITTKYLNINYNNI